MEIRRSIEERIDEWRIHLHKHDVIHEVEADELEDHLRSQIEALQEVGLKEDEAFLIAVRRMGDVHSLAREFAREYSERLWKQLFVPVLAEDHSDGRKLDTWVAIGLAIGAAIALKIPALFGIDFDESADNGAFYARNASLFIFPFLAGYFIWKRRLRPRAIITIALPFVTSAAAINLLPFTRFGSTEVLAILHLPIALWFAAGLAYMGGNWRNHIQRMNLVRFSGEWFIYLVLIALGGGVLLIFTVFIFESIGLDAENFIQSWMLPCGVAGAVVISGWLVETKQSIIENMAPVLTRLFTPLFTILLLSFLVAMIWSGNGIQVERDLLIGFDLLLILILGLLLYSISARDPEVPPDFFDRLQFLLVISALLVDLLALSAISGRIFEFGISPNKVAALGENLILLVNLGWAAVLYARFLFGRTPFSTLERWQTAYIPVYPIWAGVVVVVFPLLFKFI